MNLCVHHKIAVMARFIDTSIIQRARNQIANGFKTDQSGKVTYYSGTSNLDEAINRLESLIVSLRIEGEGERLAGGTEYIKYPEFLGLIAWE